MTKRITNRPLKTAPKDISGQRFGRLTAIKIVGSNNGTIWEFECDCGNIVHRKKQSICFVGKTSNGQYISCGCAHNNFYTHGFSNTALYKRWAGIKKRCYQEASKNYPNYGGRGIKMCAEWKNDFMEFKKWAEKSGFSTNLTIERIDNCKGYYPENCKWIPKPRQNLNTRASKFITYKGRKMTLSEWANKTGIGASTISYRLNSGWSLKRTFSEPVIIGKNQFG